MFFLMLLCRSGSLHAVERESLREEVLAAIRKAATFYRTQIASHGGYVYHYSVDLKRRWGEGEATADQIWVQPPGTPTVGMAYLKAYAATGDRFYLEAATAAAEALIYGQLESGGWTNAIDFNPRGARVAQYRNGKGRGKNHSSLDDGQSQAATRLLMRADKALGFQHEQIHRSALIALDSLLAAQFPNGAFPQVWTEPVPAQPVLKADYPRYDWRTEGRIKNYWDMYTLNDNLAGHVADTLIDASEIYQEAKTEAALAKLGGFLVLAQMPEPQPAWAQQYNCQMQPIWARRFEPPAIAGWESQDAMETLIKICRHTGNQRYLEPIPRALDYLSRCLLPDGRLARYYELRTNRPLYMLRKGKDYTLTYDDSTLPDHYGWKMPSRLDAIQEQHNRIKRGDDHRAAIPSTPELEPRVRQILQDLDSEGRWICTYRGEHLVGQPDLQTGTRYISSEVFSNNIETLSEYLALTR